MKRLTTQQWEMELGGYLRGLRLERNVSQKEFAAKSGIGLSTLIKLEAGKGSTLKTFIRAMKTLGQEMWFENLEPKGYITPEEYERRLKAERPRERASKKIRKDDGDATQNAPRS